MLHRLRHIKYIFRKRTYIMSLLLSKLTKPISAFCVILNVATATYADISPCRLFIYMNAYY